MEKKGRKETCDNLIVAVSRIREKNRFFLSRREHPTMRTFSLFHSPLLFSLAASFASSIFLSPPRLRFRHPSLGAQKAVKAIKVPESSARERERGAIDSLASSFCPGSLLHFLFFFLLLPFPVLGSWGWFGKRGRRCKSWDIATRAGIAPGNCTGI